MVLKLSPSVFNALKVEYKVICALMLRETHTIYGHTKLGYLWALIQSAFNVAVFWGIRELLGARSPHGMSVALFLIVGFSVWGIIAGSINKCINAVSANKALLTFPQVTELDVMISRVLVLFFTQTVVAVILIFMSGIFHSVEFSVNDFGSLYLALMIAPLLGLGLGTLLASFAVFVPSIERLTPIALRLLFFISGVFFSASTFNQDLAELLLFNPIFQIIELSRNAFYYGYPTDNCSWLYVIEITIIVLSVGLLMERYVRSRRKA